MTLDTNDLAEVTGTFKEISIANVEVDYDFDLEQGWQVKLQNQPILVADMIF